MRIHKLAALCVAALAALSTVGIAPAHAATTQQTFLTFYGWWDNTPPGGAIAYPQIHSTAGGKGTYSDPITFATSSDELSPGTKVWVPRVRKYFIMEDSCQECEEEWDGEGPNGGPGLRHIDLWIGGKDGSAFDAIDCEDALTHYNSNGTPTMEPVVVNPASNEVVDSEPLFNTTTGECYGGAQPNVTVGQYRNVSNGQCLENPGNSSTSGTALKTAACNGSAAQRFTFHGAFLVSNDLCANDSSNIIKIVTCTGGPTQQWSINPNLTISDIQTGQECFRISGTNVVAGSCSGSASQWNFTASASNDFSLNVSPASGSVTAGDTATATVNTAVLNGTAQSIALTTTSPLSVAFSPSSVTAGASATMTISTTAATPPGTYTITIKGTSPSTNHSVSYALTVAPIGGAGRYEAENAAISQGMVASNHLNYSGTGFVDYTNISGSYVEFTVNATAAGTANVVIRYSNGTTTNRPMNLTVNGAVAASNSAFNGTTNWDTWATKSLPVTLTAGANTIRFTATTANGGPNVDYLDVSATTPPQPVTKYEAENGTISQGILETLHPGYSGTAYVNCDNVTGSYLELAVNRTDRTPGGSRERSPAAGSVTLRIRYSNGTAANRPAAIAVNGTTVASGQAFNPTTNWDTWADVTLTVSLNAGANTIRITGTTATGPANLDFIEVTG